MSTETTGRAEAAAGAAARTGTGATAEASAAQAEIRAAFAAAGLPASDTEITFLATGHARFRAAVEALYAVPQARYVDPALRFRAEARVVDWA